MLFLLKKIKKIPIYCVWEITNACNLRCIHCESSSGKSRKDELTTEEALSLCNDLKEVGTKKVNLSGGEPLVREDWKIIASRLKELSMEVNLITNGLLFSEEVAEFCTDINIDWISISIDGMPETHDSIRLLPGTIKDMSPFRSAYQALVLSKSSGLKTSVITHINGRNLDELYELHELLSLIPIDGWQLQLGTPQGRMKETEDNYLISPSRLPYIAEFIMQKQSKPFKIVSTDDIGYYTEYEPYIRDSGKDHIPYWVGCYAGILGISIESNGNVKGCPSMPSYMNEGNIRKRKLKDIWEDDNLFSYNRKWNGKYLKGFCRKCEFRRICRAGCKSFALASTGSIYENKHCLYRVQALGLKD